MKKEKLEEIITNIRRQHEEDLDSLEEYIRRHIPIDEDTIEETPKNINHEN